MIRFLKTLLIAATLVMGQTALASDDAADLTRMLNEFLAGASINDAAAPAITLRLTSIALAAGAVVLLPSLAYLFRVFKSE